MMDWLAKLLDLPKEFLTCTGGSGGGIIQVTGMLCRQIVKNVFIHRKERGHMKTRNRWSVVRLVVNVRFYLQNRVRGCVLNLCFKTDMTDGGL